MELIATSGFNGKNGTKFDLNLYYDVIYQNIAENKSTIRYYLYFTSNSGYSGSGSTVTGKINGTTVGTTTSISARENKLMGTKDEIIEHNPDGTFPNTSYTAIIDTPWTLGDAEVAGTLTSANVATITRASSVSCTDANIGSSALITISNKNTTSPLTHKLWYVFNTKSGDIVSGIGVQSWGFPIPHDFYSQIPNARDGHGTIYCETYYNGTKIGDTQTCSFRVFTVESDCTPTVTATIEDIDSALETGYGTVTDLTGNKDIIIKNVSNVRVVNNATARNYASIKSKRIECGDGQVSTADSVIFTNVKSGTFTISATDSRNYTGYTSPSPIEKPIINYIPLTLNANIYRPQPTTGELNLELEGNYFTGSFGKASNSLEVKYRYKETGGTYPDTYTTVTATINTSKNEYSVSLELDANFDYQKSYDFEVVVSDKVKILSETYHVSEGVPMLGLFKTYIEVFGEQAFVTENNRVHIGENIDVDIFTGEERRIGTWIDGKPLYRKVITGNIAHDTVLQSDVELLLDCKGMGLISGVYRSIPFYEIYGGEVYQLKPIKNMSNQVLLMVFSEGKGTTALGCSIIIEYTKTTD